MVGVVADRVIVELEAKLDRYNANVTQAMRLFERGTASIRADAVRTETQIRSSFEGIRKTLLASVSIFAGAAGANALKNLADGYTRYTNQLKVAGLEGAHLAETQTDLFNIAQKYGVQLESIGTLYSRAVQAGDSLGASQSQLLKFTTGVAAALKIQGGSADETKGALLQLSQLLGTGTVRAEEFNSVNEGARPILQAVAQGIDKYGGSVAKLRNDVIAGNVTSQDFFNGFLKGSASLEAKAAKANLTIGASFTVLNNALGKYIGETDQALSLTARISAGIGAFARNLDSIVPALAGIAAGYAALKLGPVVFDLATAATARALEIDKALAAQILLGNASYASRTRAAVLQAQAASATAATEIAALEAEVAARTVAVEAAAAEVAAKQSLIAASGADVVAREALVAAVVTNTEANAALAVSETALVAAQGRAAVAAEAEAVAVASATAAKRAGTVVTALFSGTLATLGAALPIIAVGAITAAIIYYASHSRDAAAETKAFAEEGETLAGNLALAKMYGDRAAGAIQSVGSQAATATPLMRSFASATGEAAQRLYDLAKARRAELLEALHTDEVKARQARETASADYKAAGQSEQSVARFGYLPNTGNPLYGPTAGQTTAKQQYDQAAARERSAREAQDRVRRTPLEGFLSGSEKEGGRDIPGELARVTRDLTIARERGLRAEVDTLQAQQFEINQYKKYRAQGLSPQASQQASNKDKSNFEAASRGAQGDRSARAGAAADRRAQAQARAAARHQAALEKDAAGDAARYASLERRANNDIAAAHAELADSAEERAVIEKARIDDDRQNRNEELRQSFNQGQLGTGAEGKARLLELTRLNDERAALEQQVVDLHERQRIAGEAKDIALAGVDRERDLLNSQIPLLDTNKERRDAALRLLELQYQQERIELEAITVANGRTATEEKIAKARLAQLDGIKTNDVAALDRQYQGPLADYLDSFKDPRTQVEQAVVDKLKTVDEGITDAISKQLGIKDPFLKKLLQIFIEQNILKPLYEAMQNAGNGAGPDGTFESGGLGGILKFISSIFGGPGGGGGKFGGLDSKIGSSLGGGGGDSGGLEGILALVGSLFGRASGGHVVAGNVYKVNETGVEGFRPAGSGQIVPLGRMNGGGGNVTQVHQTFVLDARYGVTTPELLRHVNRVATSRAAAAGSASYRASQEAVPGRLQRFNKLGG